MLKVVELTPTIHYTFNMKRGDRYIGLINGKRHWKALVCGHPVPMYQTKRCKNCWMLSKDRAIAITKSRKHLIKGSQHHSWKGGKIINTAGYVCIRIDNKYIPEHRLVMEKHLERNLVGKEEVHHINGNKQDNRIQNLMLFSDHAEHIKYEHNNGVR